MGKFSIDAESVRSGAEILFAASDLIYEAMNTLATDTAKIAGGAESDGFVGIAECVEAAQLWDAKYIAVHRADIEDAAMSAAVSAESSEEVDYVTASMFEQYAENYFENGRNSPTPERPAPDPSAQMPRDGESAAM